MAESSLARDTSGAAASPVIEFTVDEHPTERRLALDGLRAFAVLAVMAFHGGITHFHGGFLGVDVFFALSGFLITSLLLGEFDQHRAINLGRFWLRRAKRLLPALAVMIFVVCLGAWLISYPGQYPHLHVDVLASFFYFANWHLMGQGTSYFQSALPPSLLTHTWSLAIEEQFYLIWPIVVLAIMRWRRNARAVALIAGIGALASAALMAYGHSRGWSVDRLYYGTDTHAEGLLAGATVAGLLYGVRESGAEMAAFGQRIAKSLRWLGPAAIAIGLVVIDRAYGHSGWLFDGGFLAIGILSSTTIAYLVTLPQSWPAKLLSWRPIVYVGQISYGLYLWHYPLFHWLTHSSTQQSGLVLFALRVLATFAVAIFSYHFVEMPIRRSRAPRNWRGVLVALVAAMVWLGACESVATAANQQPTFKPPASVHASHPVRILFLGDSLSWTLSYYLGAWAPHYGAVDINGATLGCGLVPSTSSINSGIKKLRVKICRRHRNGYFAAADLWAEQIKHYQPNIVVVLAGRWEEHTLLFRGKWQTIFNAPIRRSMAHSIALITSDARASGARTVLLTMPCVPQGEANDGSVFPENQPGRQRAYNQVLRHVARQLHDPVINLNAMVCPNGVVAHVLDGYLVRAYDGVHFGADSAPFLAPRLFPKLVRLGQAK